MPFIALIVVVLLFLVFLGVAPKFFKVLVAIDLGLCAIGFVGLFVIALFSGGLRGGRNAGMFGEEAMFLLMMLGAAPVLMVIGVLVGWLASAARQ